MTTLRAAIAAVGGRERVLAPLVTLVWARIGRVATRFEALLARLAAGTLPPPRVRTPRTGQMRSASVRLPRAFGWVVQMVPGAGNYGSQLQALLDDPAMAALLRDCPQAQRILKPLCWMLGVPGRMETPRRRPRNVPAWEGRPAMPEILRVAAAAGLALHPPCPAGQAPPGG